MRIISYIEKNNYINHDMTANSRNKIKLTSNDAFISLKLDLLINKTGVTLNIKSISPSKYENQELDEFKEILKDYRTQISKSSLINQF